MKRHRTTLTAAALVRSAVVCPLAALVCIGWPAAASADGFDVTGNDPAALPVVHVIAALADTAPRVRFAALLATVLLSVRPDRQTAEAAWDLLGHGWPMLALDDTPDTVRVIDTAGCSTSVRKDAIEERAVQQVSLMPSGYDRTFGPDELADIVAFLLGGKRADRLSWMDQR